MSNILNWITFSAALLLIAAYGGSEAQPANNPDRARSAPSLAGAVRTTRRHDMKMMKNTVFAVIAAAAIAAAYAYGANNGSKAAGPKHDEITAMRLEAAKKQAELEELNALISLEEHRRIADEEADYRWVHGDAEVPEGKE